MTDIEAEALAAIRRTFDEGCYPAGYIEDAIRTLLAMLDAANADIKKWRYSNQQDNNVINTLKERIAELEAE